MPESRELQETTVRGPKGTFVKIKKESKEFLETHQNEEENFEVDNLLSENNIELLITKYESISAKKFMDTNPVGLHLIVDSLFSVND